MEHRTFGKKFFALVGALLLLTGTFPTAFGADSTESTNRYNVVVAMDASGSLVNSGGTDPDGFRFEALSLFMNLLAEQGNQVGGVVFSDKVTTFPMTTINSQMDKERLVDQFRSIKARGYTNIGGALDAAVQMLENDGVKDLPSVIILFSDGCTAMSTEQAEQESRDLRDAAVAEAARDGVNIRIDSICLNADNTAAPEEMEAISSKTGGEYRFVEEADDLHGVFEVFYNMIYGTSTQELLDDIFPPSGELESPFTVPGFGVEEVNIIAYGNTSDMKVYSPDGTESSASPLRYDTFSFLKLTGVIPGRWRLITQGESGAPIKINMIYNTNLDLETSLSEDETAPGEDVTVRAVLTDGDTTADSDHEYTGYRAFLTAYDDGHNPMGEPVEMEVEIGAFQSKISFPEDGLYSLDVNVVGGNDSDEYLNKTFPSVARVMVTSPSPSPEPFPPADDNHAPVAVQDPAEASVTLFKPFRKGSSVVLTSLFHDEDGDLLTYEASDANFPDDEYRVEGGSLIINSFPSPTGEFTVSASDPDGLSCQLTLVVRSRDLSFILFIILGIVVLGAAGTLAYRYLHQRSLSFGGTISVESHCGGVVKNDSLTPPRGTGKCKLSAFKVDPAGLNPEKTCFMATGGNTVQFVSSPPVISGNQRTKTIIVRGVGVVTKVCLNQDSEDYLLIRFQPIGSSGSGFHSSAGSNATQKQSRTAHAGFSRHTRPEGKNK